MTSLKPLKVVIPTYMSYQRGSCVGHFFTWMSLVPNFISMGDFVLHFIFHYGGPCEEV